MPKGILFRRVSTDAFQEAQDTAEKGKDKGNPFPTGARIQFYVLDFIELF